MAANYSAGAKRIYGLYDSDGPCEVTTLPITGRKTRYTITHLLQVG